MFIEFILDSWPLKLVTYYFLNTLDISWTRTSLLVCCIKTFTGDNQ